MMDWWYQSETSRKGSRGKPANKIFQEAIMFVDKKEFFEAVTMCKRFSAKSPGAKFVFLSTDDIAGNLRVEATRDDVWLRVSIPYDAPDEIFGCAEPTPLLKVLKSASGSVKILQESEKSLRINGTLLSTEVYAFALPSLPKKVVDLEADHILAIKGTAYAVCKPGEGKVVHTGTSVKFDKNGMQAASIDGFRLAVRHVRGCFSPLEITLNPSLVKILPKKPDKTALHIGKNHHAVCFNTGRTETIAIAKNFDGEFMDYERVFESLEAPICVKVRQSDFLKVLDSADVISREDALTPLRMEVCETCINVKYSSVIGSFSSSVDAEALTNFASMWIGFNLRYLQDSLKSEDSEFVTLMFSSPTSPALIRQGDGKLDMILPVRVRENAQEAA
jgi:hypothetical protein